MSSPYLTSQQTVISFQAMKMFQIPHEDLDKLIYDLLIRYALCIQYEIITTPSVITISHLVKKLLSDVFVQHTEQNKLSQRLRTVAGTLEIFEDVIHIVGFLRVEYRDKESYRPPHSEQIQYKPRVTKSFIFISE